MFVKKLIIEHTEFTPKVILDNQKGRFLISGESRPENTGKFYKQILDWLNDYYSFVYWKDRKIDNKKTEAVFEFKFEYFNSASAKCILDILKRIKNFHIVNINIKVRWYFDASDLDMKESGEEFAKISGVPFKFIVK